MTCETKWVLPFDSLGFNMGFRLEPYQGAGPEDAQPAAALARDAAR